MSADVQPAPERRPLAPASRAVSLGRPTHQPDAALNTPLVPAATYVAGGDVEYGRYGNPTWTAFEEVLGSLEGGRALTYSSGMAAATAVLDLVAVGETVVVPVHAYQGVLHQLGDRERRGLLRVHTVDITDTEAVVGACADAALVWLESPTNPMLEVADLAAIGAGAKDAGARVVVDNTFATPLLQQPLDRGADVVLHSATKYLAGHSDALLGALVTRDDATFAALDEHRRSRGAVPGVLESWLAARGVRTLHVRLERAQANAAELAVRLNGHPAVSRVRYPGWGAMLAIEVAAGALAADLLTRSTSLWVHATSLGGVESLLERRRRWKGEPESVPDALIRLSVGIEDVEDLWADLASALASLPTP
ncbi:MAG: PLP-dependent transferase [Actinomycetota bacterium]|nr:PLP-dependent transferase [Actinomycetota bacterium]